MRVRRNSAIQLATIVALGTLAAHASGQAPTLQVVTPQIIEVAQGDNAGPMEQNGGAGQEQADVTYLEKDGKHYVVSVYMSSNVTEGYWQCKCSSFELTATGPRVVADNVQLTNNTNGERPCNHPRVSNNGQNIAWIYGTDEGTPEETATYVQMLDEACNILPTKGIGETITGPVLVSDNPDNDCGAPDMAYSGETGAASRFTAGYLDAGGGGQSTAIGLEISMDGLGEYVVETTYRTVVNDPGNIGRPTIAAVGLDRSVFCSAMGEQRPPDYGVDCDIIDSATGQSIQSEMLFESDMYQNIYYNNPKVVHLGGDIIAVSASKSNGEGQKTDEKGSSVLEFRVLRVSDEGFEQLAYEEGLDLDWQTHGSICAGAYGPDEAIHLGVMGAPITGVGQPVMQMLGFQNDTLTIDKRDQYIAAKHGDSGYAANMYGDNPGDQGRDFLRCIGSVPNPGFDPEGLAEGNFMPQVKSFFIFPVAGKKDDQEKNALFMSFVPGASAVQLSGGEDPGGEGEEEEEGGTPTAPGGNSEQAGGCGCSTVGSDSSGAGLAALLGLGLLGLSRRRRRD